MAERATVFQTTQIAVEVTPGTVLPAVTRLLAFSIEPKPMIPVKPFRNLGSKFVNNTFNPKEWTQADVKGEACYESLVYLFSAILTTAVITTPGGGTNSRIWTFTMNTYSPDTPKTFTIEAGSSAGAERFAYGCMDTLALRFTKDEVGVTGAFFGQKLTESITLTGGINAVWTAGVGDSTGGTFTLTANSLTTAAIAWNATVGAVQTALDATFGASQIVASGAAPTYTLTFSGSTYKNAPWTLTGNGAALTGGAHTLTLTSVTTGVTTADLVPKPVNPTEVQVLIGATIGGLTVLTRAFETDFSITNRFTQVLTLNSADPSFSAVVERAPDLECTILMEHESVSAGFMTDMRAKTTKFCRIVATTTEFIEGAIPWILQLTFPFRFKENSRADKDDVWCSTYKLQPIYDAPTGYALQVVCQNTQTALK